MVLVLVAALLLGACEFVIPTPPPGAPVPTIEFTTDRAQPLSGVFTITATPVNFSPTGLGFRIDDYKSTTVYQDNEAPFTLTVDTKTLKAGPHQFWVSGGDATYRVRKVFKPTFVQPPNVVTVLVDDLDKMTTPLWDAMPKTKALVADTGMDFSNMFITDPTCCPSRATMITGRYPHNTGVYDNSPPDGGYEAFAAGAQNDTIGTRLQARGYTTAFMGKYMNLYDPSTDGVPPGWNEWFGTDQNLYSGYDYDANHNGTVERYGSDPDDWETDVLSDHAQAFIDQHVTADPQRPFYLQVNTLAPHANVGPPVRYQPNPFAGVTIPTRPNTNEADVSDKPTWLRTGVPVPDATAAALDLSRYQNAIGSLLGVDDLVSNLFQKLSDDGVLANTVFVFTSDNGMNWRSHRLQHKMAPYEESLRVPFYMTGPGIAHRVESHMMTNLDYTPTVLALAGAGAQPDLDGRNMVPIINGANGPWRKDFLVQYHGTYGYLSPPLDTLADVQAEIAKSGSIQLVPTYRAIRNQQYLYVEWYGGTVHEYELYDLSADPYEMTNLVATPEGASANASLTATLQARMNALSTCAGPSCRT